MNPNTDLADRLNAELAREAFDGGRTEEGKRLLAAAERFAGIH